MLNESNDGKANPQSQVAGPNAKPALTAAYSRDCDPDDVRNPVEILAEEFASRIRSGENPTIEEYAAKCPSHAKEIRLIFPSILSVEKISNEEADERNTERKSNRFFQNKLDTIADFEIIRELGRGGMGVVYEARQKSLNRRVALKTINPAISNSAIQLQRFKREAEAVAHLHHTNIVQVFGTGEENGVHFFAMQLINGCSLASLVKTARIKFSGEKAKSNNDANPTSRPLPNNGTDCPSETIARNRESNINDCTSSELNYGERSSLEQEGTLGQKEKLGSQTKKKPGSTDVNNNDLTSYRNDCSPSGDLQANLEPAEIATATPSQCDQEEYFAIPELFQGLSESEYIRTVCRLVANVASAIHYAHEQGVLHRDIKPSNLLLDQEGTVWITDFGLAKVNDVDDLTQTGNLIGTLRYMAPEQFDGKFDARSDIYSLGLTLYELLALRPAFDTLNQSHAVNISSKRKSPPMLRMLNRSIPRDLETITAKAISIEPEHRFSSAKELEDELNRFLIDQPVKSRPVSSVELVWRWAKRNPAIAALSSLALMLLVGIAVVATIGNIKTQEALAGMKSEFNRAEEQKQIANQNLLIAKNAIQDLMQNLAERGLFQQRSYRFGEDEFVGTTARLSEADVKMLSILLNVFQEFSSANETDLSQETADAHTKVGDILQKLGRYEEAVASYEQSLEIYRETKNNAADQERNPQSNFDSRTLTQIKLLNEIAVAASLSGDFDASMEAFHSAEKLYLADPELSTSNDGKFEYARTLNIFASSGSRIGQYAILDHGPRFGRPPNFPGRNPRDSKNRSDRGDRRKRDDRELNDEPNRNRAPADNAGRADQGPPKGGMLHWLGGIRNGQGQPNERNGANERNSGIRRDQFGDRQRQDRDRRHRDSSNDRKPSDREPPNRFDPRNIFGPPSGGFGGGRPPLGFAYFGKHRFEFLEANKKAEKILDELISSDESNAKYRLALARCLSDRLRLNRRGNQSIDQENLLKQIVAVLDELGVQHPESPVYLFEKAETLHSYNSDQRNTNPSLLENAIATAKTLTDQFPNVFEYQALYADTLANKANYDVRNPAKHQEAIRSFEQVIEIYKSLTVSHRDAHQFQLSYAMHLYDLSGMQLKKANKVEAKALLQTAAKIFELIDFGGGSDSPASKIKNKITSRLARF